MKQSIRNIQLALVASGLALATALGSCKKLIEVAPPGAQVLGPSTFKDSISIELNVIGMYGQFSYYQTFQSLASTLPGMSADELRYLGTNYDAYINNGLKPDEPTMGSLWNDNYTVLYIANSIIGNMNSAGNVSASYKNQVIAEARFVRAFCYVVLVSRFGDVPLLTTTDVQANAVAARTPVDRVYDQVVADLQYAEANLPAAYTKNGGARTRATTWAAKALLARVYLYQQRWQDAAAEATGVINNTTLFAMPTDLTQVFSSSSKEAILQFYNDQNGYTNYASTVLPNPVSKVPSFYLTPQLLQAFETGDARKAAWTASVDYNGITYTYPYKYRSLATGANAEYNTVLRLAEQYLVRAEARAHNNDLPGAKADIDAVRTRAGLGGTSAATQHELLAAVAQENRIEFNCEWGHRWADLKRTGTATAVLSPIKPGWKATAVLYPVPLTQIQLNNNLQQNTGY